MKKSILTLLFAVGAFVCVQAQLSIPTSKDELNKEVQQIKTETQQAKTEVTEAVKTSVTGSNLSGLITLIKSKVKLTAAQEAKITAITSKIDLSKASTAKDQLKTLVANADFKKIFSSDQFTKLKTLVTDKISSATK